MAVCTALSGSMADSLEGTVTAHVRSYSHFQDSHSRLPLLGAVEPGLEPGAEGLRVATAVSRVPRTPRLLWGSGPVQRIVGLGEFPAFSVVLYDFRTGRGKTRKMHVIPEEDKAKETTRRPPCLATAHSHAQASRFAGGSKLFCRTQIWFKINKHHPMTEPRRPPSRAVFSQGVISSSPHQVLPSSFTKGETEVRRSATLVTRGRSNTPAHLCRLCDVDTVHSSTRPPSIQGELYEFQKVNF